MQRTKENHVFEFRKGGVVFERRWRLYTEAGKEKVNPSYIPTATEIEPRLAGGYRPYLDGKLYKLPRTDKAEKVLRKAVGHSKENLKCPKKLDK